MKPLIYIESSVVSYLTARDAPEGSVKRMWQEITRRWWQTSRVSVDTCISTYVLDEIETGDKLAAQQRMDAVSGMTTLSPNIDIERLADYLILGRGLPAKAKLDALHIACAAYYKVDIVLTWNFKHIANPTQMPIIRGLCAAMGYRMPELISPVDMLEEFV